MSNKRKRTSCSLKEKLELFKRIDNGESATKLALEYGIGKSTISDWKKNRAKIEQFCATVSAESLKSRHSSKGSSFKKVDDALFLWFIQERERGTTLSGPIIREKAVHLNKLLDGDPNFIASNGWLDRWKKRHGVNKLTHDFSVKRSAEDKHQLEFKDFISSLELIPQQIYNSDETGLKFKVHPCSDQQVSTPALSEKCDRENWNQSNSEEATTEMITHAEGLEALERALMYVEQHSKATPEDVMFIKRWRDIAASSSEVHN